MTDVIKTKEALLQGCIDFANKRIDSIQEAIISARQGAAGETKSSAGDKYETGRAMMHLEIENQSAQLNEAQRLVRAAKQINLKMHDTAQPGSLVMTDKGAYFISIGAGIITVQGQDYFAVGSNSPIGKKLTGLKKGDHFELNGKRYEIENIY